MDDKRRNRPVQGAVSFVSMCDCSYSCFARLGCETPAGIVTVRPTKFKMPRPARLFRRSPASVMDPLTAAMQ